MPVGITNMLTTECSKPRATKVTIGNHAATILPMVELVIIVITTPRQTNQLQRIPLMKTVSIPALPSASFATVLISAAVTMRTASALGAVAPIFVSVIANRPPKPTAPSRLPRNTQYQLATTVLQSALPSSGASGSSPKLPVTSSSPSSTIITKPTGNAIAPASDWPVETVALNERPVAAPSKAPEIAPRISRSRGLSASFLTLTSTIAATMSEDFAKSISELQPLISRH